MADITMCANKECPLRETCYRVQAPINEYRQSWSLYDPDENGVCDHYVKTAEESK
jgi:hypothetical protein